MSTEPSAWIDVRLVTAGRTRTGPVELRRERPWGTVWWAPTDRGPVWLKRPGEAVRFEIRLLQALERLTPRLSPTVLGADDHQILLADAGRSYREAFAPAERVAPFTAALTAVGALQRAAAPLLPQLVRDGVADLRPGVLPAVFDELVATLDPGGPIRGARIRLVDVAAELERSAVPASVDHNDLHDDNVMTGQGDGAVVIDWGDAVLTQPFATLLVPQRVLAASVGADPDRPFDVPVVAAARRAYLAGFGPDARSEDLERTARFAVTVAHVARAWVWRRAMTAAEPDAPVGDRTAAEFAAGARGWLSRAVAALVALPG